MDTWLGWVIVAGLFFLMMRFGCGSHMMRGHGKEAGTDRSAHGGCCGAGHEEHAARGEAPAAQADPGRHAVMDRKTAPVEG